MTGVAGGGESAPGWRVNPSGETQWWTGDSWGPRPPTSGDAVAGSSPLAVVAHMGMLFGTFLLPLVIYLVTPRSDRFTRHHAAEGLNWQLTFLIWWLACFAALTFVVHPAGPLGVLLVLVVIATFFAALGFSVAGMIAAARGRWWRYPVRIPFVRGPQPSSEV